MTTYIPTICFMAGLVVGAIILCLGMFIGWKASYSIRNHREGYANDEGSLFKTSNKEPAEFDLIKEEERKEEERFDAEE